MSDQKQALIDMMMREGLKQNLLTDEEVIYLRRELQNVSFEELMSEYIPRWYGDVYRWQPVDVRTWLFDEEFMGLQGQIWPVLAEDFIEMMSGGYHEAILEGSIGWGKSFISALALVRMVYELSCFKNPAAALGLADGSPIVLANIATKEKQAKDVVFGNVVQFVRRSPYFRRHFPLAKDLSKELLFPQNISVKPAASTQGSVIGQNLYGAVMDEINFLFRGQSDRSGSNNQEFDLAKVLHTAMGRRMFSRFKDRRGLLMSVSSSMYPDDFTAWRKKQADELDERIFYRRYSQWTPRPEMQGFDRDPKQYFWLSIGDSANRPRVLRDPAEEEFDPDLDDREALEAKQLTVLKVPNIYRLEFLRDIDMAVRDIAGYATNARHPFFRNIRPILDSFERAQRRGLKHPWSTERTTLLDDTTWVKDRLDWDRRLYHHFAHVDLAISQDAAGIAIVRLDGVEETVFERPYYDEINAELRYEKDIQYVPKLSTVMTLQIKSEGEHEIPVAKVRQILMDLVNWGFLLTLVTYDQYQSAESIQALLSSGVEADKLSVDRTMDPYHSLKEAFDEDRLDTYEYPILLKELSELERDLEKKKIDHPPKGSKDCADGLAGAVHNAAIWVRNNPTVVMQGEMTGEGAFPSTLMFGEVDDPEDDYSWLFG